MCSVSSLYGYQAITGLLKSCKGWGKVLWEIQNLKIQMFMDHSNIPCLLSLLKDDFFFIGMFSFSCPYFFISLFPFCCLNFYSSHSHIQTYFCFIFGNLAWFFFAVD